MCVRLRICVGHCVEEDWIPLELEFTGNCEQPNMDAKNQTVVFGNKSKCFIHWDISHVSSWDSGFWPLACG